MHLINTRTLELESFSGEVPPYAILSHTWLSDIEEVMLREFHDKSLRSRKAGLRKIQWTCQQAVEDGFDYVWVDTCCIDKSSSAELSEAINSMFKWYQASRICYAYLDDVEQLSDDGTEAGHSEFAKSRWFTRGWTLQELIAPPRVVFFGTGWRKLGDKSQMLSLLHQVTGVSEEVLSGGPLRKVSVAKRMSWAASRKTKRVEDTAYCLMGLFGVNMPMLYGEGSKAFIRLQEEILKESDDQSLFAWTASPESTMAAPYRGIFAESPKEFADSNIIIPFGRLHAGGEIPPTPTSRGVRFTSTLHPNPSAVVGERVTRLLGLNCRWGNNQPGLVCIEITSEGGDLHMRSRPSQLFISASFGEKETVFVRKSAKAAETELPPPLSQQYGIYISHLDKSFRVERTYPASLHYDPGTRVLEAGEMSGKKRVLLRCANRRGFLELRLWPTPAEADRPAKCSFRARWTVHLNVPLLYTSRESSRESQIVTPALGLWSLFWWRGPYVEVTVKPTRVQEFDMFCVEVRKASLKLDKHFPYTHISSMRLSEWFLIAVQVSFLCALPAGGRFDIFIILIIILGISLMIPLLPYAQAILKKGQIE